MPGSDRTLRTTLRTIDLAGEETREFPDIYVTGNGWVKNRTNDQTYGRGNDGVVKVNEIITKALTNFWSKNNWAYPIALSSDHETKPYNWSEITHEQKLNLLFNTRNDAVGIAGYHRVWGKFKLTVSHRRAYYGKREQSANVQIEVPKIAMFWDLEGDITKSNELSNKWVWYDSRATQTLVVNNQTSVPDFTGDTIWNLVRAGLNEIKTGHPKIHSIMDDMGFVELLEDPKKYLPSSPNPETPPVEFFYLNEGMTVALAQDDRAVLLGKEVESLKKLAEVLEYIGVDMEIQETYSGGNNVVSGIRFTGTDPKQDLPHVFNLDFANGFSVSCGYVVDEENWLHHKKRNIADELAALEEL